MYNMRKQEIYNSEGNNQVLAESCLVVLSAQ